MKNIFALATTFSLLSLLTLSAAQGANSCWTIFDIAPKDMINTLLEAQLSGISESAAFIRNGLALEGDFKPSIVPSETLIKTLLPTGKGKIYGGVRYVEFPNSTAMTTVDPVTGQQREFILTRGVKPYVQKMNSETGSISPEGYVSDVLLFERVNGKYIFRHRVLASKEEAKFYFEDPRISIIHERGETHYFLSGTDYSSHRPGSTDPDVMNRYVQLKVDSRGLPLKVEVDAATGKPNFSNLSPAPQKTGDGWAFVDAKNGTIAQNEFGEIVIRTRMRPDFGNPEVRALAGEITWQYAEQVFTFKDWQSFKDYNWDDALVDLFGKRGQVATQSASGPKLSKILIRDQQLKENLTSADPALAVQEKSRETPHAKGKGLGPGTRPLRIQRKGSQLFISDGPGAVEHFVGVIPRDRINQFVLKDEAVTYLTFDHEIRYVKQNVNGHPLLRRHYSASLKFFDASLTEILFYRPDAIQPKTPHELGLNSGITDLLHVYPMGFVIAKSNNKNIVRVYAGASDAHTTIYDFNIMTLLLEMER